MCIEYGFVIMGIKNVYTPIYTLNFRQRGGHNFWYQETLCVANVNPNHDQNVLNPSKSVTELFILFMSIFLQCINHKSSGINELLLICRVITEVSINFQKFTIRKPLRD